MTKLIVALLLAVIVVLTLCAWLDGGAKAQAGWFEPQCECRAILCWYAPVTAPDEWWPAGWLWQIERWRIAAFWDAEVWRCGR